MTYLMLASAIAVSTLLTIFAAAHHSRVLGFMAAASLYFLYTRVRLALATSAITEPRTP